MSSIRLRPKWLLVLTGLLLVGCATLGGDSAPDKLALVGLLKDGQFATLEATMDAYQERFEADPDAQWPAVQGFEAFKNSDPAIEPRLNEWVAKMPDSYAASLARGVFKSHLGMLCTTSSADDEDSALARESMQVFKDHFTAARGDLERALALNPRLVLAYETLAQIAQAEGDQAEMRRILDAGLAQAPDAVALHYEYLSAAAPDEIHNYLVILRERHPKVAARGFFRGYEDYLDGQHLLAVERYAEALAAFDRALAFDPRVPAFLAARAHALFDLHRYDEAIATLQQVLEIRPQAPDYHAQLAAFYMLVSRHPEALASMDKAIALDRLNPCYLWRRGGIFDSLRRYTEAAADLDAAMIYGSYDAGLLLYRSRVLMRLQSRFDDAVAGAKRATELQSWNSLAWLRYAEALYYKQDCKAQEALRTFREVCQRDGGCAKEKTDSSASGVIAYMGCPKA